MIHIKSYSRKTYQLNHFIFSVVRVVVVSGLGVFKRLIFFEVMVGFRDSISIGEFKNKWCSTSPRQLLLEQP